MRLWVAFFLLAMQISYANDESVVVAVGQAQRERGKILFVSSTVSSSFSVAEKKMIDEFMLLLRTDFSFYKRNFQVINSKKNSFFSGHPDYKTYQRAGYSLISKVAFSKKKSQISYQLESYSIASRGKIFESSGSLTASTLRENGHDLSHRLYTKVTGKRESIFHSKILFVSDRRSSRKRIVKELYIMDFDGGNKRRLTNHWGLVISPGFSPDGKKVLYSLIRNKVSKKRNINLYIMDLTTGKSRLLSSRPGINSGAVFMPDGQHILLTLGKGNAEIYSMNIKTRAIRQVTRHYTPDVDPSINRNGDRMVFLSGRSGSPMIYIADPRGKELNVKRIGFVGKFNATPRFSPNGQEIAFSSWLDNRFDIFRISSDGTRLFRLTKDFGSNEDPTYSNDGEFIAFSSQRVLSRTRAVHKIYVMDREGEIIGSITDGFGNCITPRWSR